MSLSLKRKHFCGEEPTLQGKFSWEIKSWHSVRQQKNEYITSDSFYLNEDLFLSVRLKLFINLDDSLIIGFETFNNEAQKFTVEVSLVNSDQHLLWVSKLSDIVISYNSPLKTFPKIKSRLIINEILRDNEVKILCDTKMTIINYIENIQHIQDFNFKDISDFYPKQDFKLAVEKDKSGQVIRYENFRVSVDKSRYEQILNDENFSDVILKVDGQEVHAHKIILANKSPVFEAMFKNMLREKKENIVNVFDIKYNVMIEMLKFIYTDNVDNIEDVAEKLMIAADKYAIEDLKRKCEIILANKINNKNLVSTANLANLCNSSYLEKKIIDFIVDNKISLVNTKEFRDIAFLNPDIMVKVCKIMTLNFNIQKV